MPPSAWPVASTLLLVAGVVVCDACGISTWWGTPWVCALAIATAFLARYELQRGNTTPALLTSVGFAIGSLYFVLFCERTVRCEEVVRDGWTITLALVGTLSLSTGWALRGSPTERATHERTLAALGFCVIAAAAAASVALERDGDSAITAAAIGVGASIAWAIATTNLSARGDDRLAVAISLAIVGTFAIEQAMEVELYGRVPMSIYCSFQRLSSPALLDDPVPMRCMLVALAIPLAATVRNALHVPDLRVFASGAALAGLLFVCAMVRERVPSVAPLILSWIVVLASLFAVLRSQRRARVEGTNGDPLAAAGGTLGTGRRWLRNAFSLVALGIASLCALQLFVTDELARAYAFALFGQTYFVLGALLRRTRPWWLGRPSPAQSPR